MALEGWESRETTTASRSRSRSQRSRNPHGSGLFGLSGLRISTRSARLTILIAKRHRPGASPAQAPDRRGGNHRHAPEHARQPDEGRDHRAAETRANGAARSAWVALRRLGLDGPLQPIPAPVPLRPPERLRPGGDLHLLHATHAGSPSISRVRPTARPCQADRGAGLLRRDPDRRILAGVQRAVGEPGQPPHDLLVLSDGWDTGEPRPWPTRCSRSSAKAGRLIWLNPLLAIRPTSP